MLHAVLFSVVSLSDPGILTVSPQESERLLEKGVKGARCPKTGVLLVCRSRYVPFINEVVGRFDHYCDWVHNAIGAKNHRGMCVPQPPEHIWFCFRLLLNLFTTSNVRMVYICGVHTISFFRAQAYIGLMVVQTASLWMGATLSLLRVQQLNRQKSTTTDLHNSGEGTWAALLLVLFCGSVGLSNMSQLRMQYVHTIYCCD